MRIFCSSLSLMLCVLFTTYNSCMDHIPHIIEETAHKMHADILRFREDFGAVVGAISPTLGAHIKGHEFDAIKNNPYKNTDARVRQGTEVCDGEKEYRKHRFPITKAALATLLDKRLEDEQVPTVAATFSGGGYRAALWTLGVLLGMEEIGLLDGITYITALSGSTGTTIPWIGSKKTLKEFKNYILDCVTKPFISMTDREEVLVFEAIAVKKFFNEIRTPVDLYSDLLGNRFLETFGDQRHMVYLSQQADIIKDGSYPYLICTAIDGRQDIVDNQTWYEYTTDEIGNPIDETYIPTWAYGRVFKDGISIRGIYPVYPPEKNIAYQLGTFWSAFGANMHLIKEQIIQALGDCPISQIISHLAPSLDGERPSHVYAEIPNYMYKMKNLKNPQSAKEKISERVDAGTNINLPVCPVNRPGRCANLIIICDASAGTIGDELKKTVAYMGHHKYPFPPVHYENIDKKTFNIFVDEKNPATPIVAYSPRINDQQLLQKKLLKPEYKEFSNLVDFDMEHETNKGCAQTKHFNYERSNAEKIVNLARFNILANRAKIIKALQLTIQRKTENKS